MSILNKFKNFFKKDSSLVKYADCLIRNEKGQLLLLQRSSNDTFQPNKWCLPGGHIENGEYPEYAAARELLEETNLQTPLEFIQAIERKGSISLYFQGFVHSNELIILDNEEHFRLQWVNLDELDNYDLILDLKDILKNNIQLPIYSLPLMKLEVFDANDLIKRQELVEKSFNNNQMSTQDYFKCKKIIKFHQNEILKIGLEKGLINQDCYDYLIKSDRSATVGEKREFAGKMYIKTTEGWECCSKI